MKYRQTTIIYPLSLHDALPISVEQQDTLVIALALNNLASINTHQQNYELSREYLQRDRKSTRQNYSHVAISYAASSLNNKRPIKKTPNTSQQLNNYS